MTEKNDETLHERCKQRQKCVNKGSTALWMSDFKKCRLPCRVSKQPKVRMKQ